MDIQTKREIKAKLRIYPQLQSEVAEKLADIAYYGATSKYGSIGGGGDNKNFSDIYIKLADSKDFLWCKAIENTLRDCEGDTATIIRLKYFGQKTSDYSICRKVHYSRTRLYDRIEDFINQLHKYAIKYSLLDV